MDPDTTADIADSVSGYVLPASPVAGGCDGAPAYAEARRKPRHRFPTAANVSNVISAKLGVTLSLSTRLWHATRSARSLPCAALRNGGNVPPGKPQRICDRGVGLPASRPCAYQANVCGRQDRVGHGLAVNSAPLTNHVCDVVPLSAREQVLRIHARRGVAAVKTVEAAERAVPVLVRETMGVVPAPIVAKLTVSLSGTGARPKPARRRHVRRRHRRLLLDLRHEAVQSLFIHGDHLPCGSVARSFARRGPHLFDNSNVAEPSRSARRA